MENAEYLEALIKLQEKIVQKATEVSFKCADLRNEENELLAQEKAIQRAIDEAKNNTNLHT